MEPIIRKKKKTEKRNSQGVDIRVLFLLFALTCTFTLPTTLAEDSWQRDPKSDFYLAFRLMWEGAYKQFAVKTNLYYLPPAVAANWYAFEHDKRISAREQQKKMPFHIKATGELGVAMNFPIVSAGAYWLASSKKDNHLAQFSVEYFSTLYLVLIESAALSFIRVHERPVADEDLSFWETTFRGDSSYPSGHVAPYMTLFFKTLQFYGPAMAIVPGVLSLWASQQRMRDGKHYLSDVVGTFFLSAFASEGVRYAAGYEHNHPFYKRFLEHDFRVGVTSSPAGSWGPMVSWSY